MMDAVKFLTEKYRMCRNIQDCRDCELNGNKCCNNFNTEVKAEKAVALVERWSREHPKKTRASEFLKVCPNTKLNSIDGFPALDPCVLDPVYKELRCDGLRCAECREQLSRYKLRAS